jgi:hypothetical protein
MRCALYAESNAINLTIMKHQQIESISAKRVISFKVSEETNGRSKIVQLPMDAMNLKIEILFFGREKI